MVMQELYGSYILYGHIKDAYGGSRCWISEIAEHLRIAYADANYLTFAMGYRRGRARQLNTFASFSNDAEVRRIVALIEVQRILALIP